jgi:hypothetical protein
MEVQTLKQQEQYENEYEGQTGQESKESKGRP